MVAAPLPMSALPLSSTFGKLASVEGDAPAVKVTGEAATLDRAVTPATPLAAGRRNMVEARPELSVAALETEICAPGEASNVTIAPPTGLPEASVRVTTSGVS